MLVRIPPTMSDQLELYREPQKQKNQHIHLPPSHQTDIEFLIVDGVKLEVQRFPGQAGKPMLVFLHEGLGCIDMWRNFPARLSTVSGCPHWSTAAGATADQPPAMYRGP